MFKSNVKKIMEQQSLTLRGLAAEIGISDRTILRARKDEMIGLCKLETLQAIAHALGVSTKDLYDEGKD
jgi:DNA-binding Xre family transcriptional regulator